MVVQFFPKSPVPKDQKHDRAIVFTHCTIMAMQVSAVAAPALKLVLNVMKRRAPLRGMLLYTNLLAIPGFIGIAAKKMIDDHDPEKNKKRAFNLQRNAKLTFREDWTLFGLLLGAAVGSSFGFSTLLHSILLGSSLGFYTGQGILFATNKGMISSELKQLTTLSTEDPKSAEQH